MSTQKKVVIVGVGLIGGSIGLALKRRGLAAEVVGVGRRQASLDRAMAAGTVDRVTTDLSEGVAGAEVVVVATPVASVVDNVCQVLAATGPDTLVTDGASTKAIICTEIGQKAAAADRFVGSHPLAGDHRSGPENARGDLFDGRKVVVTPVAKTQAGIVDRVGRFWESLGSEVVEMSPEEHDRALATTSHLPHLIASAVAATTPSEWLPLAATGWADTTRIAAANPELWMQIFEQNELAVRSALESLIGQLQQVQAELADGDWDKIQDFLQRAKRTRDALGN